MRKTSLKECNAEFALEKDQTCYVLFDCPEGHDDCRHAIPFTPSLEGVATPCEHALWQRTGDTVDTLTLSPSILRRPRYASREAAIEAGCIPEYVTEGMLCGLHIFVKAGRIEFCGDSK